MLPLASLTFISSATASPLHDISGSYAEEQIQSLYEKGIVLGDEKGLYHPEKAVTRAEFITMLDKTLGLSPLNSNLPAFRDVSQKHWSYPWVQAGVSLGLINGTSTKTFAPTRAITREEAATLLIRAFYGELPKSSSARKFDDQREISAWAAPYVQKAAELSIMNGFDGEFRPADPLTRQEIAVILERISEKLEKQPSNSSSALQIGWQYALSADAYIQTVKNSEVNVLSPRWYFLEKSGTLSDSTNQQLVQWAHSNNKKVWALVGNRFDPELTEQYLGTASARKSLVEQLVAKVKKYDLDGINIDFEGFKPDNRDQFTAFIKELGTALKKEQATLSVDVPPNSHTSWSDPFDFAQLGKYADYVVAMSYEEHWSGGPTAGSVASLPWYDDSLDTLLDDVPADKLIAGIPLFTRDWYKQNGKLQSEDLTLPQSYQAISGSVAKLTWTPAVGQYTISYTKNGLTHQIWMEDSRSLALKYLNARQMGLPGAAYWYVGSESSDVWTSIENAEKLYLYQKNKPLQ